VTAKIKEIDVQRRQAQIEITSATSLGNERNAPQQLFAEHRAAATAEFKSRYVGTSVTRTLSDINVAF
jgi:hypothetical protein